MGGPSSLHHHYPPVRGLCVFPNETKSEGTSQKTHPFHYRSPHPAKDRSRKSQCSHSSSSPIYFRVKETTDSTNRHNLTAANQSST